MDYELGGKSIAVCGGGTGIGRACAVAFAREGSRVAILDWNPEALTSETKDPVANARPLL